MQQNDRSSGRPRGRRTSAAALGWGLACFIGIQAAVGYLINHWHPELRDPEYGYRWGKLLRILDGRPLVLALGSSRVELGFAPSALHALRLPDGREPLVFNFGLSGSGPVEEALCLHRLLALGIRPAYVLLEVLPPLLYHPGGADDWIGVDRLDWRDLAVLRRYTSRPAYQYYWRWCQSDLVPCSCYRSNLLNWCLSGLVPEESKQTFGTLRRLFQDFVDPQGWVGLAKLTYGPEEIRRGVEHARQEYADWLQHFQVSPVPDRALRDVLTLCRREQIPCLLFLMPEGRVFHAWYPPAALTQIDAYVEGLSRKFQVPLVDARSWAADADFSDGHHLRPEGALKFTREFGRRALQPFLESRLPVPEPAPGQVARR